MKPGSDASPLSPERWPRELQLLLCCAQARDGESNEARLGELLAGPLDWRRVLGSASLLGLVPLLHARLTAQHAGLVPGEILDFLRHHVRILHARNLQTVGELYRLLDDFAAHGIPVLPFKGPVLAVQAYGKLSLRPFSDLDLLVRPEDAPAACNLLLARNYTSRYTMSTDQRAGLLRFGCEHPFHRLGGVDNAPASRRDDVDLHWNLFPPSFPLAFDQEALWQRVETVTLGNRQVATIGTDTLILYLCAHGYAHHWSRLEWICALARLIASSSRIDWPWVQREAQRMDAQRVLELGLVLAGDWLGAPVPADLLATARGRPTMSTLTGHVAARILRNPEAAASESTLNEELFFDLDASENWRRRVSYFLRRLVTPSLEDVEWVSLPAKLPALYYLFRPLRLSLRYLGSASQRAAK